MTARGQKESTRAGSEAVVRRKLKEIVRAEGLSIIDDPGRLKALLLDHTSGDHKREVNLVSTALQDGRVRDLVRRGTGTSSVRAMGTDLLAQQLATDTAYELDAMRWAVESWAQAAREAYSGQGTSVPASMPGHVDIVTPAPIPPQPHGGRRRLAVGVAGGFLVLGLVVYGLASYWVRDNERYNAALMALRDETRPKEAAEVVATYLSGASFSGLIEPTLQPVVDFEKRRSQLTAGMKTYAAGWAAKGADALAAVEAGFTWPPADELPGALRKITAIQGALAAYDEQAKKLHDRALRLADVADGATAAVAAEQSVTVAFLKADRLDNDELADGRMALGNLRARLVTLARLCSPPIDVPDPQGCAAFEARLNRMAQEAQARLQRDMVTYQRLEAELERLRQDAATVVETRQFAELRELLRRRWRSDFGEGRRIRFGTWLDETLSKAEAAALNQLPIRIRDKTDRATVAQALEKFRDSENGFGIVPYARLRPVAARLQTMRAELDRVERGKVQRIELFRTVPYGTQSDPVWFWCGSGVTVFHNIDIDFQKSGETNKIALHKPAYFEADPPGFSCKVAGHGSWEVDATLGPSGHIRIFRAGFPVSEMSADFSLDTDKDLLRLSNGGTVDVTLPYAYVLRLVGARE